MTIPTTLSTEQLMMSVTATATGFTSSDRVAHSSTDRADHRDRRSVLSVMMMGCTIRKPRMSV